MGKKGGWFSAVMKAFSPSSKDGDVEKEVKPGRDGQVYMLHTYLHTYIYTHTHIYIYTYIYFHVEFCLFHLSLY